MPQAPSFPVPSASLLRFLRAQSQTLFQPSLSASASFAGSSRHGALRPAGATVRQPHPPSRAFSTTCRARRAPSSSGSGRLDLELFVPSAGSRGRMTNPRKAPAGSWAGDSYFSARIPQRWYHEGDPIVVRRREPWRSRLWGSSKTTLRDGGDEGSGGAPGGGGGGPLKPDDLPPHDDADGNNSMFNTRRTLTAKAALEPRLRCTEVDENGKVILVDGEFKKSELIAKYGLLPRDLRKIDSSNLPHILVRPSSILLNLLHLKVLIKYDRVLLFDVYGSRTSYPQSAFMYDLQHRLQQKQAPGGVGGLLPYEFRALEAVLMSVTTELEAELDTVRDPVLRVLSDLEDDIDRHKLRFLLILSKRVSTFEQKAKLVRDAITELLEADDDLAAMYLTEKTHDLFRGEDDHTEVEMLLESYNKLCDEIVQEAGNLVSGIKNTEEIIRAILDANRNSLMLLDLKFSIGTLGLAMGTFLAGLYGMNLENFIEETNWGFGTVTGASMFFSLVVCAYGLAKLRKVQRVKMLESDFARTLGGPGVPGGSNPYSSQWLRDDGPVGLLDARNREVLRRINLQKALMKPKKWW